MKNGFYMVVDAKQTVGGLQQEFSRNFPFLKVEFYREPCIKGKGTSKENILKPEEIMSSLPGLKQFGDILFTQEAVVGLIEKDFLDRFGVCMQIFRKSGNIWLETTSTDDWTLERQNEEAKSLAQQLNIDTSDNKD